MKIQVSRIMKTKTNYSSQRETVATSSIRACSFAMDDGGRCLLDVINDPLLLQSFLESGSDENSKDPQDGTSSESAVESPQVSRSSLSNHLSTAEHVVEPSEVMGFSYAVDQGLLAQSGVCTVASGMGGMSFVVAPSSIGPPTYQHASSSGATIHHVPSTVAHTSIHPHSPISARSVTPLSHSIKSPGQGPSSVHSMPPPSPLQQTRSPLPSHTPSPAPSWSPAPPVLSPATSRTQSSVPSVAFQQSHNQILQTSCSVTQFVTALANQQSITQKLTLQQQQQLFLHQQLSPSQQSSSRLTAVNNPVVTTTAVTVTPPMVQLIPAPQSNVPLPVRTSHSTVRPIQPKLPPQILPKPSGASSNQFVAPSPTVKQTAPTTVTAGQRTVGVGLQAGATGQLVIGQGQPGVFSGPQGTIVLNQIIPGVGQTPILIQGNLSNLGNLQGLQLTLRPPNSVSPGQSLSSSGPQNNATLIAALQGPSQHAQSLFAQTKSPLHGQQTIVIPNNIAHTGLTQQNLNLTSTGIPNSSMMSSSSQGQGFLARSNIILSPRVVGPNQGIQLQQIQTPQGPILAFASSQTIVPHLQTALQNAALGNPQLASLGSMHGVMATGQGVLPGLSLQSHPPQPQSALQQQQQSLFGTAVPSFSSHLEQSSHQVIQVPHTLATQQVPSTHTGQMQHLELSSPKPASPPKPSKVPGVNLEELLKEHGIVPENSPPPSPDSNSPIIEDPQPSHQIQVSSAQLISALQSQGLVLEQLSQSPQTHSGLPQLKLALTQDGSVILQPHTPFAGHPRVQHYFSSSGHIQGRFTNSMGSVILPTVTTSSVSVPVVATESSSARGHSALLARLNASPAICVPDVVTSLAMASMASSSSASTATMATITTHVPLTVQSLTVNSSPITSSYITQRTTSVAPISSERVFTMTSEAETSRSPIAATLPVASSACTTQQHVQNRINHVTSGCYQTILVSSDHTNGATAVHTVPRTVSSSPLVATSTMNSQNIVQSRAEKCSDKHLIEIADNNGAIVPSHNHPAFSSGVPNHVLQKLQKEISDLLTLKYRSHEQQKSLQELIAIQQKLTISPKGGKGCRANQNQIQIKRELEILEKLIQRPSISKTVIVSEQSQHPQTPAQHSHLPTQVEKQQSVSNSKAASANSVHLVNLLKQSSQSPSTKQTTPITTASSTTVCDSTTPTTVCSTAPHPNQRVCNPITVSPRLQTSSQTSTKTLPEQIQSQVIVRVPAPTPPQSIPQACPNTGQIKGTTPVTRIKNVVPKAVLFNGQLTKDQNEAVTPDVKTPFSSKADACERLLKYHVFNSKVPSIVEIRKADETFDMVSVQLLEKVKRLKNTYHLLQLKESMRPCATPERVMLERLFLEDEQAALQADRILVEEGKTLSLPPPPSSWLRDLKSIPLNTTDQCRSRQKPASSKTESSCLLRQSDVEECSSDPPIKEEGDLLYKEDSDNLEAPVIDSCVDIAVPQHDDNCERSPPTLKRIVIKSERLSESDSEEPLSRKRLKFHNNVSVKTERVDWNCDELFNKTSGVKGEREDVMANHRYSRVHSLHDTFQSDQREEDIMTKIRKELNISPMEMDEDVEAEDSHVVDFEPPNGTNELPDFEPPIARTDETCGSALLSSYSNSSIRTNSEMKYDFDMLAPSEWAEAYVDHENESDAAVESILEDPQPSSDLDLSGLDGLEDHLDESRTSIPNGIQEDDVSELHYVGYRIPKQKGSTVMAEPNDHCGHVQDQVQSAIKSILEMRPANRSYFGGDDVELTPRLYNLDKRPAEPGKQGHNAHMADYRSLDADGNANSGESDAALDEAVRSILL